LSRDHGGDMQGPRRQPVVQTRCLRALALVLVLGGLVGSLAGCSAASRRSSVEPTGSAWSDGRGSDANADAVIGFAWAQIGKRYCWGGTGPSCFDCSGLVQRAWGAVGVRLPRTADAIAAELPEVPLDEVRTGDILWWPGHVGLYAGDGWVVEALDRRHGVVRRPLNRPHRAFRPSG
jgi:peptidoglycan DL-endopeptidase CwlO